MRPVKHLYVSLDKDIQSRKRKFSQRKQLISATNDRMLVQQWRSPSEHSESLIEKMSFSAQQRLNEHSNNKQHTIVDVSAGTIEQHAANIRMHLQDELIMQHLRSMAWLQLEPNKTKLNAAVAAAAVQSATTIPKIAIAKSSKTRALKRKKPSDEENTEIEKREKQQRAKRLKRKVEGREVLQHRKEIGEVVIPGRPMVSETRTGFANPGGLELRCYANAAVQALLRSAGLGDALRARLLAAHFDVTTNTQPTNGNNQSPDPVGTKYVHYIRTYMYIILF